MDRTNGWHNASLPAKHTCCSPGRAPSGMAHTVRRSPDQDRSYAVEGDMLKAKDGLANQAFVLHDPTAHCSTCVHACGCRSVLADQLPARSTAQPANS